MISNRPSNRRWAVPVIALALIATGSVLPNVVGHAKASAPTLPPLTPAELLAKVRTAKVTALSGTIQLTANLGLPSLDALGGLAGGGSKTSLVGLLAGQHSAQLWVDGIDHVRVATTAPMSETNWIRNGKDLWSYDSSTLVTSHTTLSDSADDPAGSDDPADSADEPDSTAVSLPDPAHDTPIEFAQGLLDKVAPSTGVAVDSSVRVAGRPAYQLVLTPQVEGSTVKDITFAVDAATGLPLEVRVDATSKVAALDFGFTDISFDTPAASIFDFTPPPGSTVVEVASPLDLIVGGDKRPHDHHDDDAADSSDAPTAPADPGGKATGPDSPSGLGEVTTVGTDWATSAIVPTSQYSAQLASFLTGAQRISVGSQSARVLTTRLFTVLVFDDGHLAVGALTPAALAAVVAAG